MKINFLVKLKLYFIMFFLLPISSLIGQKLEATLSMDTVYLGNSYQLTISLDNVTGEIDLPRLEGLGKVIGPSSQISSQYINGISSTKKSYTYTITPREIDHYIIPSISLYTPDSVFTTDILSIVVLAKPSGIIQKHPLNESFLFNHSFNYEPPSKKIDPPKNREHSKLRKKLKKI